MKPKISIIVPSIRTDRLEAMYHSINQSVSGCPWELIIVGPYALPSSLQSVANVKYCKDFGNPVRCSNIGLMLAEGELLTWQADDATWFPGMLDKAIEAFEAMTPNLKNVLILKYTEGPNRDTVSSVHWSDDYYKLLNAYPKVSNAEEGWWIFNFCLMETQYTRHLGGWDCRYETSAFSHADFAVRAQMDGCITQMFPDPIVWNDHGQPDHRPIEDGHNQNDMPLYIKIHNDPSTPVVNTFGFWWADSIWQRRFNLA